MDYLERMNGYPALYSKKCSQLSFLQIFFLTLPQNYRITSKIVSPKEQIL